MDRLIAPIQLKEAKADGSFTGYAAVFNNVDLGGDVILPGAFTHTPSVVSLAKPVSNRPLLSVSVSPLIATSASIRPYFCPHIQHSAQRN